MNPTTQDTTTPGEPLAPLALVSAAVSAVLALLAAFGLDLSAEQTAAILGVVASVGPLVVWLIGRRRTVPADNVVAMTAKSGQVVAGDGADATTGIPVEVTTYGGRAAA